MKAVRLHGGEATSRRISANDGGREPKAPLGVEVPDMKASLMGLEGAESTSKKSSKAEEGWGDGGGRVGLRHSGDCLRERDMPIFLGLGRSGASQALYQNGEKIK